MFSVNVDDVYIQDNTGSEFVVTEVYPQEGYAKGVYDKVFRTMVMFHSLKSKYTKKVAVTKTPVSRVGTQKFKVGDTVICTDQLGARSLVPGMKYKVLKLGTGPQKYQLFLDTEYSGGYSMYRFQVAEEVKDIKVGKKFLLKQEGFRDCIVEKIAEHEGKWVVSVGMSKALMWATPDQCTPYSPDYTVGVKFVKGTGLSKIYHFKTEMKWGLTVGQRIVKNNQLMEVVEVNTHYPAISWLEGYKVEGSMMRAPKNA